MTDPTIQSCPQRGKGSDGSAMISYDEPRANREGGASGSHIPPCASRTQKRLKLNRTS